MATANAVAAGKLENELAGQQAADELEKGHAEHNPAAPTAFGCALVEGGAYAMLVCLATFTCLFIVVGFSYSYGVFQDEFVEVFGETHAAVSSVYALVLGFGCLLGPLTNAFVDAYGSRLSVSSERRLSCAHLLRRLERLP